MLTTREVIKTFYNALLQRLKKHRGDWNQNDPTADDYIKNRPFYTDENDKTVNVPEQKITIPSKEPYAAQLIFPELIEFVVGQTYEVKWDDETYSCVAFDMHGISAIGNLGVFDGGTDTGEPFIMMISKTYKTGIVEATTPKAIGTHTVEVTTTTTKVVTLDRKYLPDLGLAPVATSGSYDDLEDAPIVYSDVVRYDASQSLSTTQKNQAKINIGAVSYDSPQSLTDTQKQQARTNIGAGTSSFDGVYSSLTGAPSLAAVATSGSYNDLSNVPIRMYFNEEDAFINNDGKDTVNNGLAFYNYLTVGDKYMCTINGVFIGFANAKIYSGSDLLGVCKYLGNLSKYAKSLPDTGEDYLIFAIYAGGTNPPYIYKCVLNDDWNQPCTVIKADAVTITPLADELIPSTIQRVGDPVILSDANGAKWRLIVGTDGALTTEAVTE